jgi:hypothetical protein
MKLLEGTCILLQTAFVLLAANWFLGATAQSDPASIPDELPQFDLDLPRSLRFPAKEQRLKIYLSNWYVPNCENYSEGRSVYTNGQTKDGWPETFVSELKDVVNATTFQVQSTIVPDTIFALDRGTVLDCSVREGDPQYKKRIVFRRNMYMYCLDVANTLLSAMDRAALDLSGGEMVAEQNTPPVLLQFGDLKYSHDYGFMRAPHIKKFRIAAQKDQVSAVTSDEHCYDGPRAPLLPDHPLQPIIWKLASRRHYGFLDQVAIKDRPWEEKKNMAVFRGQLTGSRDGYNKTLSASLPYGLQPRPESSGKRQTNRYAQTLAGCVEWCRVDGEIGDYSALAPLQGSDHVRGQRCGVRLEMGPALRVGGAHAHSQTHFLGHGRKFTTLRSLYSATR